MAIFEGILTTEVIEQTRRYLDYLESHINNLKRAWVLINEACPEEKFVYDDYIYSIITDMVEKHDLSKLYEEEFVQYRRHFYRVGNDYLPDEPNNDYDKAWKHHLKANVHHWENWTQEPNFSYGRLCHCICMILDWLAMGMYFQPDDFIGNTWKYYNDNKSKMNLPEWAEKLIYNILNKLSMHLLKTNEKAGE